MMLPDEASLTSYRAVASALDAGELTKLAGLLRLHPSLVGDDCCIDTWYETGYFRGATLLHHVGGNATRCPLPANILDVARVPLEHGAYPNAATDDGRTTIGLILRSRQASEAAVALPLIDLLRAAMVRVGPETLARSACVLECKRREAPSRV